MIEVTAPEPAWESFSSNQSLYSRFHIPDWPVLQDANLPALPYQMVLLDWPFADAEVAILSAPSPRRIPMPPPYHAEDVPSLPEYIDQPAKVHPPHSGPDVLADLVHLGRAGGEALWGLRLYPYQYDAQKQELSYFSTFRLQISSQSPLAFSGRRRISGLAGIALPAHATSIPAIKASTSFKAEGRCKIYVNADGLYRITGADLRAAGIPLIDIDIKKLKLSRMGQTVPLFVSGWRDGQFHDQDYFEFWGEALRQTFQNKSADLYQDPFSNVAVYWLSWDAPLTQWMNQETSESLVNVTDPLQRPFSFYETVHIEQDASFQHYYDISQIDSLRDYWLYDAGIPSGSKRSYPFKLYHPDVRSALPVHVHAMLTGLTPDNFAAHQAALFLNDRFVIRGQSFRQDLLVLSSQSDMNLTASYLTSGANTMTIVNEYAASETDYISLNWFEITYPRLYRAQDNVLKFSVPPDYDLGMYQFTVDGFTSADVEIFKLGSSKIEGAVVERVTDVEGFSSYRVQFNDTVPSRQTTYVAVTGSARKTPLRMEAVNNEWTPSADGNVDYVAIVPRKWARHASLTALMQYRQSHGHHVAVITLEDILDHFNHGVRSPYAIKSFLSWAYQNWPLRHVLLVGDGSYRRQDANGDTLDIMPVFLRQTLKYGAASCDYWYTLLDGGDELADVWLGRLPVTHEDELEIIVDKILAHENGLSMGTWRNRLLFIGGNGLVFRDKGMAMAKKAPPAYDISLLFTTRDATMPNDPYYGNTPELLDHLDQGCAVVNFHGHGGGAIWSDNGLLRLEDVEQMSNRNRYPVVFSMTCYTGAFEQPTASTLAEKMLSSPERGTMAFLGASGFGWRDNDDYLQSAIMEYLYEHPDATLGEIVFAGKTHYFVQSFGNNIALAEVNQYNLFGDPAMRLRLAAQEAKVVLNQKLFNRGDTVICQAEWPFSEGTGEIKVAESEGLERYAAMFAVVNGRSTHQFILPASFSGEEGVVRLYAEEALGVAQCHGASRFSLGTLFFDSTQVVYAGTDTLYLKLHLTNREEVKQVWCLFGLDTLVMQPASQGWYQSPLLASAANGVYAFMVETMEGTRKTSAYMRYKRPGQINLEIESGDLAWAGVTIPALQVPIRNWGDGTGPVTLRVFYWNPDVNDWQQDIASDTVTIPPLGTALAELPLILPPGPARLALIAETPGSDRVGTVVTVTVNAFALRREGGFLCPSGVCDSVKIDAQTWLVAPPGMENADMVVFCDALPAAAPVEQPGFLASARCAAYEIRFSQADGLRSGIFLLQDLSAFSDMPGAAAAAAVFSRSPITGKWRRQNSVHFEQKLQSTLSQEGRYAVLWPQDTVAPQIQVLLDGKPYTPSMYVSREPHITVRLQDDNGIDVSEGSLVVLLDGRELDRDVWTLPDSIHDGNQVVVDFRTPLQAGQHRLQVAATDCNGNSSDPLDLAFQVAGEFAINWLGNYPNPFAKNTVFAYVLTQPADMISLKIYTAAGRKILETDGRRMGDDPNPLSSDYHEILWDGTDAEDQAVANGVYFYRFVARANGITREVTGKIVRLR